MDSWRYFDFAKEIISYVADWVSFLMQLFWIYKTQAIAGVVIGVFLYKLAGPIIAWTSVEKITATVTHKERVYYPKWLYSVYLVYTDQEVLCVQDTWAFLRFGASDRYSRIQIGSTYTFTVCGYRNRWASSYRNVLKAEHL